jgi:hypothetical protein
VEEALAAVVLAEAEVLAAVRVGVEEVTAVELVVAPAQEVVGALAAVRVVVPGRAVAMALALVLVRVQEQALARVPQPPSVLVPMRQ